MSTRRRCVELHGRAARVEGEEEDPCEWKMHLGHGMSTGQWHEYSTGMSTPLATGMSTGPRCCCQQHRRCCLHPLMLCLDPLVQLMNSALCSLPLSRVCAVKQAFALCLLPLSQVCLLPLPLSQVCAVAQALSAVAQASRTASLEERKAPQGCRKVAATARTTQLDTTNGQNKPNNTYYRCILCCVVLCCAKLSRT